MTRQANLSISSENEAYIKQGWYPHPTSHTAVDLSSAVSASKRATVSYSVEAADRLLSTVSSLPNLNLRTLLSVTAESSTAAAERLQSLGAPRIAVLNFASARNPGGGYIKGAQAQEEDICRSSALYTTLLEAPDFYAPHQRSDGLYSHRMVYSPCVPMYRATTGSLLPAPYTVDFITAAAPNCAALATNHAHLLPQVPQVLKERAERLLAVCAHHGARTLVLGAWGCGVFRNDPAFVAKVFHDLLKPGGVYYGQFESAVFAIYDTSRSQEVMGAFDKEFGTKAGAAALAHGPRPRATNAVTTSGSTVTGSSYPTEGAPSPPRHPVNGDKPKLPPSKNNDKGGTDLQARITRFFKMKPKDA